MKATISFSVWNKAKNRKSTRTGTLASCGPPHSCTEFQWSENSALEHGLPGCHNFFFFLSSWKKKHKTKKNKQKNKQTRNQKTLFLLFIHMLHRPVFVFLPLAVNFAFPWRNYLIWNKVSLCIRWTLHNKWR